ncbi:FLR1 [Candida pseudojiufengensis]|uniref:FLR1 n=1 Tax=Candida pseudojiufengensis TaxID=497109 RepID=UPI00222404EE|nr:FLR1 [Candida pseudojiufengensis]KAI5959314.1 FLR1 [Candida pseudojiufengensis]
MSAFLNDSFMGRIIYHLSGRKLFLHNDEKPGYVIPEKYLLRTDGANEINEKTTKENEDTQVNTTTNTNKINDSSESSDLNQVKSNKSSDSTVGTINSPIEKDKDQVDETKPKNDYIIVTWDGDDDPENPLNRPLFWKSIMAFQIAFMTTSVYMGSAIYTPGIIDIMEKFNIGQVVATLPLTLFVVGYGIGPIIFSPLSEDIRIGRTPLYIITIFIFCMMQIPTALSQNIAGLCILRFIAGFFASPCLSTGGASVSDFISLPYIVIGLATWSLGAVCGPSLGPLIGAVLVVRGGHNGYESWRWTFWFMALLSSCFIILAFTLPETYSKKLLRNKAIRLRRLTGNNMIRSEGELELKEANHTLRQLLTKLFWRPFKITFTEPVVLLIDIYIALVYSIMYMFFEAVPIVFQETKHFALIPMGCAYLSVVIGIVIGAGFYIPLIYKIFTVKVLGGQMVYPEVFIPPAIFGSCLMPVGLFIFAWTSSPDIHWFPPLIGLAFFAAGAFFIFQTLFNYMAASFKVEFLASVFSSNNLFRSTVAASMPLYSRQMFNNLGSERFPVGWGTSLLSFICVAMISIPVLFYLNGTKLRARSQYAY